MKIKQEKKFKCPKERVSSSLKGRITEKYNIGIT